MECLKLTQVTSVKKNIQITEQILKIGSTVKQYLFQVFYTTSLVPFNSPQISFVLSIIFWMQLISYHILGTQIKLWTENSL